MIEKKYYIQDENQCFYIYRQTMNGKSQIGLVMCASVDDYINNIIKKHEKTRADKERDRINHVDYCDAHTGPIFLTYRENYGISKIIDELSEVEITDCAKKLIYSKTSRFRQLVKLINKAEQVAKSNGLSSLDEITLKEFINDEVANQDNTLNFENPKTSKRTQ